MRSARSSAWRISIDLKAQGIRGLAGKNDWPRYTEEEPEVYELEELDKLSLRAWKAKANKNCNLVSPTSGWNPKLNFLDSLKSVAERARLDPENFWLHKFRATFASRCLWAGVDLRTVQQWLGRSDMESTCAT
jgi:site-specific recombinase XerD